MIALTAPASLSMLDLTFASTPLALPFLATLGLVVPAVVAASLRSRARETLLLVTFAAMMAAVLVAQSVFAFMLAWELMALVSAMLVGAHFEHRYVRRALLSYAIVGQIGALCILGALALLGAHAGAFTFDAIARSAPSLPMSLRISIALLALAGFGSKAGLVPMHFWLPSAHPAAPATASALLSGVMLAVAVYGLALVGLVLAQPLPVWFGIALAVAGALGGAIGALYASLQTDVKRILAYSSIENMGIAISVLGLAFAAHALGLAPLAALAMLALFFHVVSHGAFKSLLFLGAGTIVRAAGTSDLEHLGGLMRTLRFTAQFLLVGCAAAAALPVTGGFAAEWLVFRSFAHALASGTPALAVAAAVTIAALALAGGLAFATFAKFFGIGMLGQRRSDHVAHPERFDLAAVGLAWLSAIVVAIGVAPELLSQQLGAAVQLLTGAHADLGALPHVARIVALAPLLGLLATAWVARSRSIARQPTWTCGSPVTRRSQYTATAFTQPIARIFAVASAREPAMAFTRSFAAFTQRTARRTRIVQGGRLRVYLAYAVLGALVIFWLAR